MATRNRCLLGPRGNTKPIASIPDMKKGILALILLGYSYVVGKHEIVASIET